MIECVKNGLSDIFRNKLRSILTIGGIFIGVLSVVIISTIGDIGTNTIDNELINMGMDSVIISGKKCNETGLSDTDLMLVKGVPAVSNAMPLMYIMSDTDILNKVEECMLWGVNEDADNVIQLEAVHGRLINKGDIISNARVCVIDEQVAYERYKRTNIVGKTISIRINDKYEEFKVVGIVNSGVNVLQNMLGGIIPEFVYIPHTTMAELSNQTYYDEIAVKLDSTDNMTAVSDEIERTLFIQKGNDADIRIENLLKQRQQLNDILGIVTLILSVIAGISLVVSGLSIMTVMLVSVNERTREIGIKKSIGATNKDIMTEFLIESVLITLFGGVLGSVVGIILVLLGCAVLNLTPVINIYTILSILGISVLIGLTFGVYPASRASKLKPVDALRHE